MAAVEDRLNAPESDAGRAARTSTHTDEESTRLPREATPSRREPTDATNVRYSSRHDGGRQRQHDAFRRRRHPRRGGRDEGEASTDDLDDEFLGALGDHLADRPPRNRTERSRPSSRCGNVRPTRSRPRVSVSGVRPWRARRPLHGCTDLWNSVRRHFDDRPGAEKAGYGQ